MYSSCCDSSSSQLSTSTRMSCSSLCSYSRILSRRRQVQALGGASPQQDPQRQTQGGAPPQRSTSTSTRTRSSTRRNSSLTRSSKMSTRRSSSSNIHKYKHEEEILVDKLLLIDTNLHEHGDELLLLMTTKLSIMTSSSSLSTS